VPGKELFQFYDDTGEIHSIHSGMVNEYIQEISGKEFSAKDFRTWSGSISAITICNIQGSCEEQNAKQKINEILDEVAKHLGNTRNVCRKYYVYPSILELYQTNKLNKYLPELNKPINTKNNSGYTPEENVLMKILKSNYKTANTIKV
jgi:DNA topoisomerase-1